MRLVDVVNQLRVLLPKYTDKFSTSLSISSIIVSGNVATIITDGAHGLRSGESVTLSGVESRTPIDAVSQGGLVFTYETSLDHDLTLGWVDHDTVSFEGFADAEWNNSFTLLAVQNRQKFNVQSTNSLPTLSGNEVLLEVRADGINGRFSITVTSATQFTISGTFNDGTYSGGTVSSSVRVAGSVDIERTIEEYTEQETTDLWGFVIMHDAEVSKDRSTFSDATGTFPSGTDIRTRIIDGFSFYIFVNTTQDIAAQDAVDICRHDLMLPIMKSIYGSTFTTGLSGGPDFRTILTGHGIASYNKAFYSHVYNFEVVMDLTNQDQIEPSNTRAFRDIDYTQTVFNEDMTVNIDLDEEPLL